jgi:hypothetical protein
MIENFYRTRSGHILTNLMPTGNELIIKKDDACSAKTGFQSFPEF